MGVSVQQGQVHYLCRLHFYNSPITDDFSEASHPLNIIRSICEPGDFIVVKLDIDNGHLESAILAEIGADPELRHCISEMYYEQHYDHAGALSPLFHVSMQEDSLHHKLNCFRQLELPCK